MNIRAVLLSLAFTVAIELVLALIFAAVALSSSDPDAVTVPVGTAIFMAGAFAAGLLAMLLSGHSVRTAAAAGGIYLFVIYAVSLIFSGGETYGGLVRLGLYAAAGAVCALAIFLGRRRKKRISPADRRAVYEKKLRNLQN